MASVLRLVGARVAGLGARTEEILTNQPFLHPEGTPSPPPGTIRGRSSGENPSHVGHLRLWQENDSPTCFKYHVWS